MSFPILRGQPNSSLNVRFSHLSNHQRLSRPLTCWSLLLLTMILAACDPQSPTLTPTRIMSGPTMAPSPTIHMFSSEELYGTSVAFGGDGQNNSTSAPLPSRDSLPPIIRATAVGDEAAQVEILLEDATSLSGDLYSAGDVLMRGPGLLLIGPAGAEWGDVPTDARSQGITVLVVPLRVSPTATDLRTLLTSLSELPTVDPSRLGVVVQGDDTDIMFGQCAAEPLCGFAALIGPHDRDTLLTLYTSYRPRPVFLAAGENDAASVTAAVALVSVVPQEMMRYISLPTLPDNVLVSDPDLATDLVTWVQTILGASAVPEVLPTFEPDR